MKGILSKFFFFCSALIMAQNSTDRSAVWEEVYQESRKWLDQAPEPEQVECTRSQLNKLTSSKKEVLSFWVAAIEYELISGNSHIALGLLYKSLQYHPGQTQLQYLSHRLSQAMHSGQSLDLKDLWTGEKDIPAEFRINTGAESRVFSQVYRPQFQNSFGGEYRYSQGSLHLRLNYAYRFEENALQLESDWYPKLSEKSYAYLNYGYSKSNLFPEHRAGLEYFTNLPRSWEASLGARFLSFQENKVSILTASGGYYYGNYYSSLRAFIVPKEQGKPGFSAALRTRRYLKTAFQYLDVELGGGYDTNFQQQFLNGSLASQTQLFIQQQFLSVSYHHWNQDTKHGYRIALRTDRLELPFNPGAYTWSATLGLQYQWGF